MTGPFMRWLGGKWRVSEQICLHVPECFHHYCEPMLGSGGVLLRLIKQGRVQPAQSALLADANPHLIRAWQGLMHDCKGVKDRLFYHAAHHSYGYFLLQREMQAVMLDEDITTAAAWFMYLNRASFNGLWRVASDGTLNSSWGSKSTASIQNFKKLDAAVAALRAAGLTRFSFVHQPVLESLEATGKGSLVYVDPPYVGTYVDYLDSDEGDWAQDDAHTELAGACWAAAGRGAVVLLSQSVEADPLYSAAFMGIQVPWKRVRVQARRSVSRDPKSRGLVNEILYVLGGEHA